MKAQHIGGLVLAAIPPLALFLVQSWLVATEQTAAVLSLAKFSGLIGLIFFAFDGSSGLIPAMLRLRHSDVAVRRAYGFYRAGVLGLLIAAVPVFWHFTPDETGTLLPFLTTSLLLRFLFIDADLDRRGFQHWAMLLQNGWMVPLGIAAAFAGKIDAEMAGHAALWSSAVLALPHVLLVRTGPKLPDIDFGPALAEIIAMMGAQGIGQVYGRAVLFFLGASFVGPLPALIIYAKQAFNAAGLVVIYLRRVELAGRRTMGLSLIGQAVIALLASVLVALAAARLGVAHGLVLAILAWQSLEKLSSTTIYAFQLESRHALALSCLVGVCIIGIMGLILALWETSPLLFIAFETVGYVAVLALWLWNSQAHLRSGAPR